MLIIPLANENNKTAGIAKAVINGIGIFKGSVNKEFSIAKQLMKYIQVRQLRTVQKQQPVLKTD